MKKILFILLCFIFSFLACSKVNNREMIVVKDCTGSYLRFNENDYKICNIETVTDLEDGTIVTASFREIDACTNLAASGSLCELYHKNKGWVNVAKIENN